MSRRVATLETEPIQSSLRDETRDNLIPALKRQAKFDRRYASKTLPKALQQRAR